MTARDTNVYTIHRDRVEPGGLQVLTRESKARKGKTDWAAGDALTDAETAQAVRDDPDAVPVDIDWSAAERVIPPKKKAISIRVDADVLDYFKQHGSGYQRRINAVLRAYMEQTKARLNRKKRA